MSTSSIAVVGGGIVGLATAWKLSLRFPDAKILLFEKEASVGRHQSGHNSGVLHCGLYYQPGSLKARLAVAGIREMVGFCEENGIAHEICGKLVVATDEQERKRLDSLEERGRANGLGGLRRLGRGEMREREPHVAGIDALEVPQEGIVDYGEVCRSLQGKIEAAGNEVLCGSEVVQLSRKGGAWIVKTRGGGEWSVDFLVNCGGLHSDRICRKAGSRSRGRIIPFRGEYYKLAPSSASLVRHLIYPVPDPAFPFLGVHFTRLIGGGVEAGPNAVLAFAREGYRKTQISPRDLLGSLTYPGLWRFLFRYPKMCVHEIRQSFSKARFCESLRKLVPEIEESDLQKGGAGVRAQALSSDGSLVQDFSLVEENQALHVLNAPSPAATASLAIGAELTRRVAGQLD